MKEMIDLKGLSRSFLCKVLILICLVGVSYSGWGQVTLLTENFGTGTSLPSGWTSSNTTNGWSASTASVSSGYTGASGGTNALFNGTGTNGATHTLTYSGIVTTGYTGITVLWGGRGTTAFNGSIIFQWSPDGTTWNNVTYTYTNNGNSWALVNSGTRISLPSGAQGQANLRLRWSANATNTGNYRIDDVTVQGTLSCSAPTVSISGATTACSTVNLSATGTAGNSYSWSNSGGSGSTAAFSAAGTYTVTVTATNSGCTASASQAITVNSPSTAPTGITGGTTSCANGTNTITLTQSGGTLGTSANYQWGTGTTIGTGPISGATSASYAPTVAVGTNSYWVSVTNGSTCGTTGTGGTVTFTGSSPSTAPTSITGGAATCANGSNTITLSQSGGVLNSGANYQWGTGTTVGTNPVSGATSASYSPTVTAGSNSYWVSVAGSTVCANPSGGGTTTFTGSTTVTSIAPTATQNIVTGANGSTLTVTEGTSSASGRQWYYGTVTGGPYSTIISGETNTTYVPNFASAGAYYVVCVTTYGSPCSATVTSNEVLVNAISNTIATSAGTFGPYCNGGSNSITLNFSKTGTFTGQYNIQLSNSTGTFPTDATSQLLTFVSSTASSVTATLAAGYAAGTGYRIRVVNNTPTYYLSGDNGSNITIGTTPTTPSCSTPAAVCAGLSTGITGAGSTGATGYSYWTAASAGSAITTGTTPPGTVASGNLTTPTSLSAGPHIYYVQGDNGSCASASRQAVTVTINALPATPSGTITPTANPACTSTTLSYTPASSAIYWETASTATSSSSPTTSVYPLSSSGTIYARAFDGTCWSSGAASSAAVTINNAVSVTTDPTNQSGVAGVSASFTVVGAGTIGGYQWEYNDGSGWASVPNAAPYTNITTATLGISTTTTGMSGYQYRCIVKGTSPCTDVTSAAATLSISTSIWSNPITGTDPSTSNPFTSGDVKDAHITVSGIGRGSGVASNAGNDRYNLKGWSTGALSTTDYFEFTLTPSAGYQIDLTGFVYTGQASSGTPSFAFRSSVDAFTANIGAPNENGTTIGLTAAAYQNLSSAITFRFYAYNLASSTTTYSINDFSFTGTVVADCSAPTLLAYTTQPTSGQNINEDATFNVTVAAECVGGNIATGLNTGNATITFTGCGLYKSGVLGTSGTSFTASFVNGVATFTGLSVARSTQSGVTFTTTNSLGYTNATSNSFNIIAPSGSSSAATTVVSNDFEGAGTWLYNNATANVISVEGSGGSSGSDVTSIRTSGGNKFLSKSYTANNGTGEKGTTNVITFDPVTGLSGYNGGLDFTFNVASCTGLTNNAGGKGVDQNEDLVVEVKLNGAAGWTTVLTHTGLSNKIFAFATTPVYTLSTSSSTTLSGSSHQSAFKLSLPAGTSSFQFRITATDNRNEESWDIDNVKLTGTTITGGTPTPLPSVSVAGGDIVCGSTSATISSVVSDAQGTVAYSWSPTTALSSATTASPTASPTVNTSYTLTITDADGCKASPATTADVNLVAPQLVLPMATTVSGGYCDAADGFRYYEVAGSSPATYFFAIKWGATEATSVKDSATVTVTYNATPYSSTSAQNRDGSVLMKRYWDVNMHGQTLTQSADVKFYYDSLEKAEITPLRDANELTAESASGLTLYDVPFKWFKTVGRAMDASVISLIDGNNFTAFNNIALTDANATNRLTESGYLYARFTVSSFSGGTGGVGFAPSNGLSLPVKLIYLTATPVNNTYITLDWATASEISNSGFQIERSVDGVSFENIGWMNGAGNSNSTITYTSDDRRVVANTIYYYRLKQIDVDGQYEYSNIVSATLIGENGFVMESLKPNPAANSVTVNVVTEDTQSVDISVVNMLGQKVLGQAWQLSAGLNGTQLDISALAQGVYHVTVKSENSYFTKTLAITR